MPLKEDNYHSEAVQEIMGRVPSWATRWGVTVIAGIFAVIVLGCCIIKYPETVTAGITLTSENPPSDMAARYDGLLDTVCAMNGQMVRKGELIALLSTPADYRDVCAVSELLSKCTRPGISETGDTSSFRNLAFNSGLDRPYRLGDLQSQWSEVMRVLADYRNWIEIDRYGSRIRLVTEQIDRNMDYYQDLLVQKEVLEQEMEYGRIALERDSVLLSKEALSRSEYEGTVKEWLSQKGSLASFEASLTNTRISILQLRQQLIETDVERQTEEAEHLRAIAQQTGQMQAQIAQWKEQYAIITPSDGTVSLQTVWSRGQHVSVGDVIASIVPDSGQDVVGRLRVPSSGFGKVMEGQTVNVRLNGFPYMEFGVLKGVVRTISAVPQAVSTAEGSGIYYTVDVAFPDSLVSTYGKKFPLVQQMDGTAEIITADRRLIHRFIDPIISLFRNS